MKAISIWQPHASYIPEGFKRYETRSWTVSYRGLIAIHSAKRWTESEKRLAASLREQFPLLPSFENPVLGCVLGIARLVNVHRSERIRDKISPLERALGGYADGRFAWELDMVEVFGVPIPAQGMQGMWEWDFPEDVANKRVGIVGSRDYSDLDAVRRYVKSLPLDTTVISGGARGVDKTAEEFAREQGLKVVSIPVNADGLPQDDVARRKEYGRRAMQRNGDIIALAGRVVAFWDEKSSGTKDSIDRAKAVGKTVLVNPTGVEAKRDIPTQMTMDGFFNHYNEGAYIDHLVKAKQIDSGREQQVSKFQWKWPWKANEHQVWVKRFGQDEKTGRYQDGYRLVEMDNPEARSMANILEGFFYNGETMRLEEWLLAQGDISVTIPGVEIDEHILLCIQLAKESDIVDVCVPVNKIKLVQQTYNPGICLQYLRDKKIREYETDTLPFLVQLDDSDEYLVFNGTHRTIGLQQAYDANCAPIPAKLLRLSSEDMDDDSDKLGFYMDVLEEALEIIEGEKAYV